MGNETLNKLILSGSRGASYPINYKRDYKPMEQAMLNHTAGCTTWARPPELDDDNRHRFTVATDNSAEDFVDRMVREFGVPLFHGVP